MVGENQTRYFFPPPPPFFALFLLCVCVCVCVCDEPQMMDLPRKSFACFWTGKIGSQVAAAPLWHSLCPLKLLLSFLPACFFLFSPSAAKQVIELKFAIYWQLPLLPREAASEASTHWYDAQYMGKFHYTAQLNWHSAKFSASTHYCAHFYTRY